MIIQREKYLRQLSAARHNGMVKVITGMRRSGKSFLLFKLFKKQLEDDGIDREHIIEMAFDDFANKRFRNPEAFCSHVKSLIRDGRTHYLLLDEVQLLDDFEDVLNGFLRMDNVDVYVTGSNARFLSKDIITEFRGRGFQIHVSPLSFSEFMTVYKGSREEGWAEYLQYGGLPPVVLQPSAEDKEKVLKSLLAETYLTGILSRNRVRNDAGLEDLLRTLASCIGGLTNPQKLSGTFRTARNVAVSPNTIKTYIGYFADAFLIEQALRYDVKGRKYIGTPVKYYFSDLGLRNALLSFRQAERAHLMENAIYNELRGRGYSVDVGLVTVNGKNAEGVSVRKQLEVDFVCNRGSERLYIQSALTLPSQEKIEQETQSLRRIGDEFRKLVIAGDNILPARDDTGISYMNVFDFMLGPGRGKMPRAGAAGE